MVGGGALEAEIVRRAVIIGERAGLGARAIVMGVADRVGQAIGMAVPMMMVVSTRLHRAGSEGQSCQSGRGESEFAGNHRESPGGICAGVLGMLNGFPTQSRQSRNL